MTELLKDSSILVTGGSGLAGRAIVELLRREGYTRVHSIGMAECDLTDRKAALACFERLEPAYVFHMAGFVRGIMGNMKNKAVSFLNNTLINTHVVDAAYRSGARKIVAMGTVAAYPDPAPAYPITEDMIWQGKPHGSEDSYGQSKRAMLAQLDAYRESYGMDYAFAISTNLYGPHDNFDVEQGHVIPSLIYKFHAAKTGGGGPVIVWGNGSAQRDFMHSSDMARAIVRVMEQISGAVNVGTGHTHSIRDAVDALAAHTGLSSKVEWDETKPNGQHFRECNLEKLFATGFKPAISLKDGLESSYDWFAAHANVARK